MMENRDRANSSQYIKGSQLNEVFVDKTKSLENVNEFIGLGCDLADLEESFKKILGTMYEKIKNIDPNDYDGLLQSFTDLWMELKHINYHINQAEDGFLKLTNLFAEKADTP